MFKTVQRTAHRVGSKRSADQQDVGSVIAEFKATDDMLLRLEKEITIWRNGWEEILKYQYDTSETFASLYKPIEPPPEPSMNRSPPVQTPHEQMQKCLGLQKMYSELKDDLKQEIGMIDNKIVRPVKEAKAATKSLQKTMRHRENMKVDYERFLSRAEHARRKDTKTMKEEAALAKHEADLQQAQIDYQTADDQIKQYFPPVVEAIQALLPFILTAQIEIQTTLVGQLYTSLDAYCRHQGIPSPAPSDGEIISVWDSEFSSLRKEWESHSSLLRGGKAINMAMNTPPPEHTYTGMGIRSKSSALVSRGKASMPGKSAPPAVPRPANTPPTYTGSQASTPSAHYVTPPNALSRVSSHNDYFTTVNTGMPQLRQSKSSQSVGASVASIAAAKKKPPPPVPAKRIGSAPQMFVTALYDFEGQTPEDLPFREGDRIKVIKKTGSTDDWWEGEVNGRKGSFPANYVQL
ncbi:hypothetical protein CERZMDRAFT_38084 [Cercospora zeae-maydis SCOH1-5]|uniref:SH3 domain-containing protein n=1 Tax=Cercospora zeae-maydis SCOH1-5 TaxID=717836 RepID=A0A6A6FLH2_9PEZI|nr:hypothetical protein CERZMDRAFT_38084 [Cercospora zeae-maydis SCOH1-5]